MLYGLLAGLALGWLGGGSLSRLERVSIRWAPLAMIGLLAQLVLFLQPVAERVGELGMPIYVLSTAAVLVVVIRNARIPGLALVAAGAASNLAAILANGGYMPASAAALAALGKSIGADYSNSTLAAAPALAPLTDVFALPRWLPFANVFSVGDVLICIGVALAVIALMRGGASWNLPRRYSEPGTSGS
jgi:lipoprotein signal peptidase